MYRTPTEVTVRSLKARQVRKRTYSYYEEDKTNVFI